MAASAAKTAPNAADCAAAKKADSEKNPNYDAIFDVEFSGSADVEVGGGTSIVNSQADIKTPANFRSDSYRRSTKVSVLQPSS